MKRLDSLLIVTLLAFLWQPSLQASAAEGFGCGFFDYQEDAQFTFDQGDGEGVLADLDDDRNGVACEELTTRPASLVDSLSMQSGFEQQSDESMVLHGAGYSSFFNITLAGVTFTDDCDDYFNGDFLTGAVAGVGEVGFQSHLLAPNGGALSFTDDGDNHDGDALAFVVADDPSNPLLLNEWLIVQGLAKADYTGVGDLDETLQAAQASAKTNQSGLWGTCEIPTVALVDSATADSSGSATALRFAGDGDQIEPFTITVGGLYTLTLTVSSDEFVAVEIYTVDGTWLPEFATTTSEGGAFETTGQLDPRDYYIKVTATGSWRIVLSQGLS